MENLPSIDELIRCLEGISKVNSNITFKTNQIETETIKKLGISEELLKIPREKSRTEFQYRLAWALSKAKKKGFVERIERKTWRFR